MEFETNTPVFLWVKISFKDEEINIPYFCTEVMPIDCIGEFCLTAAWLQINIFNFAAVLYGLFFSLLKGGKLKQKDFYYSTLYIYEKVLADALAEDFAKSGERSKSKYLADLIAAGLAAKQRASPTPDVNAEEFSYKLSALEGQLSALQSSVAANQTEQAAYRMLLCNVYYLLDSLVYGEAFNGECLEAGLYDVLPSRLFEQLKRLKEAYRRAA